MSAREDLIEAIATKLSSIPNQTFYRDRQSALALSEGNAILLEPEEEKVVRRSMAPDAVLRDLTVVMTVITRDDTPDLIADPLISAAMALIMRDPSLGGLCAQITEVGTKWMFAEADQTASVAEIRYQVRYQTRADLTSLL